MVFGCLFVIHFVLADSSPFMAAGSLIFSKNMLFGAGMRHSEYLIAFYTTYIRGRAGASFNLAGVQILGSSQKIICQEKPQFVKDSFLN